MSTLEIAEGVDLHNLIPGSVVDVETNSRHYVIECLGGNKMRISGHPHFCPTPVVAELQGSVDGEGIYESGLILPGKHLVFVLDHDRPVTTSKVLSVHIDESTSSRMASNDFPASSTVRKTPLSGARPSGKDFLPDDTSSTQH